MAPVRIVPALQFLVTSRVPLHLYGDRLFPVPPMACGRAALDVTSDFALIEAIKLFVRRARAAEASFELAADNLDAVARLYNALDGLPLAIELAAGVVTLFSLETMLSRLAKCLN